MGHEVNEDRIWALEKKIEEAQGDAIQLKREHNSFLNISLLVPPEILGRILAWVGRERIQDDEIKPHFYDFLLVCHHWFEVVKGTPKLWNFWGNTMTQWHYWREHCRSAPVGLVLSGLNADGPFDESLQAAVREAAKRGTIRSINFQTGSSRLQQQILAALTPGDDENQFSSIESFSLQSADVSKFFTRCSFPKLLYLKLSDYFEVSNWELFASRTGALTELSLTNANDIPTPFQLLSILARSPGLRDVTLSELTAVPDDKDRGPTPVPMHHLRSLHITGNLHSVVALISRLEFLQPICRMRVYVYISRTDNIKTTLGPLVRDYILREGRRQASLGLTILGSPAGFLIKVSDIREGQRLMFASFGVHDDDKVDVEDDLPLCRDFVEQVLVDDVVYLRANQKFLDLIAHTLQPHIQEWVPTKRRACYLDLN